MLFRRETYYLQLYKYQYQSSQMIPVYSAPPKGGAGKADVPLIEIKTLQQLEEAKTTDKCTLLLFWAEWHEPCHHLRDSQMQEMAKVYNKIKFTWCNSDEASELVDKFDITQVPTIALFHPHKLQPELIENPSPERLAQLVDDQQEFYARWFEDEKKKAFMEIDGMVKCPFFMFIKGTPEQPKCKFTRKLLEMLVPKGYRFRTFDILKDERIRQWLKFYSSWPTFPQIFLDGKFVGGVDIVTELIEGGEFDEMVPQAGKKLPPLEEFKELLTQHRVVAIIEGTTEAPASPQSGEIVKILKSHGITFAALDVTQKQEILTAIQQAGIIATIPSLFIDGALVGDLSVVQALNTSGELVARIPAGCIVETLESRIKKLVKSHKIMLFMKGSPKAPQCGFSQRIVNLLANYPGYPYGSFDIYSDEQIREGLKKYSNWPTYPQLFVDGELIGGIDICTELHEGNELEEALRGKQ